MSRQIEADDEKRTLVARETTIKATDKTTVVGKVTLMAGAIQHVTLGVYALAIQGNRVASIGGDCKTSISGNRDARITGGSTSEIAGDLFEKIGGIRSSVAAAQQQIIAPVVWVGSQQINVMQLMLDTLDVVRQLAQLTAAHTHPDTGAPTNAAAITQAGGQANTLKEKYKPVIG